MKQLLGTVMDIDIARQFRRAALSLALVAGSGAFGADWICKEAAALREGNALVVCGIGIADDEADARLEALKRAKAEFESICRDSADCRNRELVLVPLRNSCEKVRGKGYKCYRGVRYEIGAERASPARDRQLDEEIAAMEAKLADARTLRAKEQHLEDLKRQVAENGEPASAPAPASTLLVNIDLLRFGTPAYSGEMFVAGVGGNVRYVPFSFVGIEAGFAMDFWARRQLLVAGTFRYSGIGIGYNVYGALPFFLAPSWFIAPEARHYSHDGVTRTAAGLGIGWQESASGGWSARATLSDLVGAGKNVSFFATFTYQFGVL